MDGLPSINKTYLKPKTPSKYRGFAYSSEPYWIRTSDLCPVKAAL